MSSPRTRPVAVLAAVAVAASLAVVGTSGDAAATFSDDSFDAYATGTVVHADALEDPSSGTRLADVEEASSAAAVDSTGLSAVLDELDRPVVQGGVSGRSYGRGSGLEVGVGTTPEDENQVVPGGTAEAVAPPSTDLVTEEIGPVPADPLAYASLLRGQAQARWNPECVVGPDIAHGLGYAADAQLLDRDGTPDDEGEDPRLEQPVVASDTRAPERSVSQARSRVRLVPELDGDGEPTGSFGLMSETRMTIAPVTLLRGPEGEGSVFTVEFLGEWVLRAVATGSQGSVHYGPGEVEPDTPLLRLVDEATGEAETLLRAQDLTGDEGVVVDVPELGVEIAVGEDARAIGGDAASEPTETPTLASGAVDVARIRLVDVPEERISVSDLRVGHMETRAAVPADGIDCGIDVAKDVDEELVSPGDEFTYTIVVTNPMEGCRLEHVEVVDRISVTDGVTYEVIGQTPPADTVTPETVTWDDVGPLEAGGSKTLELRIRVGDDSDAGRFTDDVTAISACGIDSADGAAEVQVPVRADAHLPLPEVEVPEVAGAVESEPVEQPRSLPRTGAGSLPGLAGLVLVGASLLLARARDTG